MSQKPFSIDINNCGLVDPQLQLGAALANADINNFRLALDAGASPIVEDAKNVCVFEKALKTHGCAEFVLECLLHGCNPNFVNKRLKKSAINFAADSFDPQIINTLLRYKEIRLDRKYGQLTPLNTLAKNLTADNTQDVIACIRLLLNHGASPNIPDQREMTPLHYILKNRKIDSQKKRELIQLFLSHNDLDIDNYRNGEVRSLLKEDYIDLQLPEIRTPMNDVSTDSLLRHLRSGDEELFLQQFREYQLNIADKDNRLNATKEQNMSLFLEAIKRGLHEAFDELLQSGLDINSTHNGNTPIEIAITWGNWLALQKLLDVGNVKFRQQDHYLIDVIGKLDQQPLDDFCDYEKCFKILLDSPAVNVNELDHSGSTPLHYAVKYRNQVAIEELLRRGAYIGVRSTFNELPITDMQPEVLEAHFDRCISTNGKKPGDVNLEIVMNFMNLIPSQPAKQASQQNLHEEMTPIAFLSESKEHRYLLQHPLISSFLFLKWHRLSVIFYINFLVYTFFAISITTHTLLKFRESKNEEATTLFGIFAWIGIIYILLREIIQFVMSPLLYFRSPINLMEIALIVLSIMTCSEQSYDRETQRVIAVFTILLVALELCLLVGSLPVLSISTHMLMLREVSTSFLKCFALYSIFVITFTLCFYILFGKNGESKPSSSKDGEFNEFTNIPAALIKTIVMLTGEFDAGDINFDSVYCYLIFLLFVIFMSIVLFNLLNGLAVSDTQAIKAQAELNGSICRANLLSRFETVLTGRSDRAYFIVNYEPLRSICRRLMNLYPNYIARRQITILPNDSNKIMIPVDDSLEMKDMTSGRGNGVAANSKTTYVPVLVENDGERPKKLLDPPVQFLPCLCFCVTGRCSTMDSRTVKLAIAVIEQKRSSQNHRQRLQNEERRLQSIEQKLERIFEMMQEMHEK